MISQPKNKTFDHFPYDMYSHFQPVYGYFIDNDPTSDTFGEVCFGQIGEKNVFQEVQSYKEDCDMSYIKEELIRQSSPDDWAVSVDEIQLKEINDGDDVPTESAVEGGNDDFETVVSAGDQETDQETQKNGEIIEK